jgi:HEPN domain-containing protein
MELEAQRWLSRAEQDIRAVSTMNPTDTPDVCASLMQQALEKMLKACWVQLQLEPPRTHELDRLWFGIEEQLAKSPETDDFEDIFLEIMPYAIGARYIEVETTPRQAQDAVRLSLRVCAYLKAWLEARA